MVPLVVALVPVQVLVPVQAQVLVLPAMLVVVLVVVLVLVLILMLMVVVLVLVLVLVPVLVLVLVRVRVLVLVLVLGQTPWIAIVPAVMLAQPQLPTQPCDGNRHPKAPGEGCGRSVHGSLVLVMATAAAQQHCTTLLQPYRTTPLTRRQLPHNLLGGQSASAQAPHRGRLGWVPAQGVRRGRPGAQGEHWKSWTSPGAGGWQGVACMR